MVARQLVRDIHRVVAGGALLAAAACSPVLPPLAAGSGDLAFKARIAERYRPGMSAVTLRRALAADGFALLEEPRTRRYSALFLPDNLPCESRVRVDWTEDRRGRIVVIQAQRHDCS